jgi:hypothetical protein
MNEGAQVADFLFEEARTGRKASIGTLVTLSLLWNNLMSGVVSI